VGCFTPVSFSFVRKICVNAIVLRKFLRSEFSLISSMKKARKNPSLFGLEVERFELSSSANILSMTTCLSPPNDVDLAGRRPTCDRPIPCKSRSSSSRDGRRFHTRVYNNGTSAPGRAPVPPATESG
jgi:hypothetical protein